VVAYIIILVIHYFPPAHHHPIVPPRVPSNPLNRFHVAHFEAANVPSLHHPGAATSTSTLIAYHHHHQTAAQSIPTSLALSKDEFYMKQRYFQRM